MLPDGGDFNKNLSPSLKSNQESNFFQCYDCYDQCLDLSKLKHCEGADQVIYLYTSFVFFIVYSLKYICFLFFVSATHPLQKLKMESKSFNVVAHYLENCNCVIHQLLNLLEEVCFPYTAVRVIGVIMVPLHLFRHTTNVNTSN